MSEEIDETRRRFLTTAAATVAASRLGLEPASASPGGELASLRTATAWLNTEPLTAVGLRGKVVLVSFWTYTCLNWLRSQPFLRAWADKYRDRGLVVIGVHSPEFGFEKGSSGIDFMPGIFTWSWDRPPQGPRSDSRCSWIVERPLPPTASTLTLMGTGRSRRRGCIN